MVAPVSDGTRSLFASEREVPYYRLGHRTNRRITDFREMMEESGIGTVHYEKTEAVLPPGASRFITPTYHTTWTNPFNGQIEVVGTVGEKYAVIQPDQVFGLFGGLNHPWTTMGIVSDGREMFGTIEWEREFTLDPNGVDEKVKSFLAVKSSNDGSGALVGGRTAMRLICFNMFRTMFRDLSDKFSIRHTLNHEQKIAKVKAELQRTDTYFGLQEKVVTSMFETPVSDKKFWDIVKTEFHPAPAEDKKGAETKWENRVGLIAQAWNGEPNATIHGTAYGAWQALIEANQWGRNIQHGRDTVSSTTGLTNGVENFYSAGAGFDAATENYRQAAFSRFYAEVAKQPVAV